MKSIKELEKLLIASDYVKRPIEVDLKNGAEARWNEKEILKSKTIFNPEIDVLEKLDKCITEYLASDFICPDTLHRSVKINANSDSIKKLYPPTYGSCLKFNGLNLEEYNRIACYVYVKATGYRNIFWNISIGDAIDGFVKHDYGHSPSIKTNEWIKITWELGNISRSNIRRMTIIPFIGGTLPESTSNVEIYINDIVAEKVVPDYEEGWELQNRIAYSHVGYFTNANKIALAQNITCQEFELKDSKNATFYKGLVKGIKNDLGQFYELDFSDFKEVGDFYLQAGDAKTPLFPINTNPYLSSIWKSISFLKSLQCGVDVPGVHSACHLNHYTIHPDGRSVPNFGGWHDAGDLSQFEICTAEMAHAILDLCEVAGEPKLNKRLLEEAKVGVEWLLRTRFGDGYRSLAVSYGVWEKNILLPEEKEKIASKAENGPFENFIAAAAQAKAYVLFKETDGVFADWSLRAAKEDYEFAKDGYKDGIYTKRWGTNIDAQVGGAAILAACELYRITKDQLYYKDAKHFASIVMKCQEQNYLDWEKPLRGFFYEDPLHTYVLYYEHRGHEQTPIQGIVNLCQLFPNDTDYKLWINCLELYKEFVYKTLEYTKPYTVVPNQLFILGKVNKERVTVPAYYGTLEDGMVDLDNQIKGGIKLGDGVYLRIFPAAVQRRGYHATLLSKAKGISMIGLLLGDKKLIQIAIDQLEWVMGKNPFSSSAMYGEGHNYHPLYVAYSNQMVGALPVGIKTYANNDTPYWPVINNAVFKEVWGHTTGKYLWVLCDILKQIDK